MPVSPEDRLAILDLINRHGHLTDDGDFDGYAEVFDDNVRYDVSALGGQVLVGLTALRAAAVALGDANPVAHHVTNIVLDDGPNGTVRAHSKGLGVRTDGSVGSVSYDDTVEQGPQGWRITQRIVRPRRIPLQP